jgi:CTP synthase (UTP-ammonia lyase)
MSIRVLADSIAGRCYGASEVTENYYCNFGLNPDYEKNLEAAGLRIAGRDSDGETRILELADHPFFIGTLFVPQTRSNAAMPHPLIEGFLRAASVVEISMAGR